MNASKIIQYLIGCAVCCFGMVLESKAQCPVLFDYDGAAVENPYWYSCSGNNYTLNLQSPNVIGEWEVDWGDGSPIQTGSGLIPGEMIGHMYSQVVDIFTVTFTEVESGCVIIGTLVMEEASSASIQIPVGGLTQACAPKELEFINSSTNVSSTTVFTWDFGDGSPPQVFDHTNWGQTIGHLYEKGTVDCETVVTLTAENSCNTVQGGPSQATFNPIRIWDLDDAAITPSALVQCYPDTTFTFTNTTERNCLFQGNIFQRQEYWNFGDYWGTGQDSIIDWTPWPPTLPRTISYPGIGTYEVMLVDSNFCGQDTTYIEVEIVAPPTADFTASADTICAGETVVFTNASSDNANTFSWYFGSGGWINSGSGDISRTFNSPGTYEVLLVASINGATGSCADTASVPVVVLPAPEAIILADNPAACDSLAVNFSDGSIGFVQSWEWVLPSGQTSSLPNPPTQYFNEPGAYTASLTVSSANGCSNTNHLDVFVHQTPIVGFVPENVCQGAEAVFTDQSVAGPGDQIVWWNWDFGGGATSNDEVATHVFPTTGTYTITLEVGTPYCSAIDTFEIEVEPAPLAGFSADIYEDCGPVSIQFTNQSAGAFSYLWEFGDGTISNEASPSHIFTNPTTEVVEYVVALTALTEFGCADVITDTITVLPGAVAQFSAQSEPGCTPFDATFINNSLGAVAYEWDFGDGSPVSTEENPEHTFTNTGLFVENYLVQLVAISATGCNDTAYTTITAYPEPIFDFTVPSDSGCSPFFVQFPGVLGAVQLDWDFGDGAVGNGQAPSHTFVNNTNQPVSYTTQMIGMSAFGCVDTAYAEIYVTPAPLSQMQTSVLSGCSPLEVTFQNLSLNAHSYVWVYGDGTSSEAIEAEHTHVFENNTNAAVEYTVSLQAETADGCVDISSQVITVYPKVTANFVVPPATCADSNVQFQNTSVNASTYEWHFGDGFIDLSTSPQHTYNSTGTDSTVFEVTLMAWSEFGCVDTITQPLIVHPQPAVSFTTDVPSGCGPLEVTFTNNSQFAADFIWSYGDNHFSDTTALVHTHTFYNPTSETVVYEVKLEATNSFGCKDSQTINITVFPEVTAGFNITPEACSPFVPEIENTSLGAVSYLWDFGNGQISNAVNPVIQLENNTDASVEYEVILIAENQFGCSDTVAHTIIIHPTPQVAFEVTAVSSCAPFEAIFDNQSEGADSFFWSFGDGTFATDSASIVSHIYENLTDQVVIMPVTLTGSNAYGCTDSASTFVEVMPAVIAAFSGDNVSCTPLQSVLLNESLGASSYSWYVNGELFSNQSAPTILLENDSTEDLGFEVTLVATNYLGCTDTVTEIFTVLATPHALFTASPQSQVFPDATVTIENQSIADSATYSWSFGDGQTATGENPGPITYPTWGEYTIQLTVDNGQCLDTYAQTVMIGVPLPVADFTGEGAGCQPVTVQFVNTSEFGAFFLWDFGDGSLSIEENPLHTFYNPGTYTVTLTATGFGGDTDVMVKESVVEVYPQAVAFFTASPQNVVVPGQPVSFLNLSENADSYIWDFGDGNTSDQENVQYYYQETGLYSVSLIANNEYQCPDTFMLIDAIRAEGGGDVVFPNAFTPSPSGPSGGYFDPSANNFNNDIFFPLHEGVDDYQLLIYNRWGELIFESRDVNIGWDGYYKGELCKQDVYVWKVNATFTDGRRIQRSGDVTLIR